MKVVSMYTSNNCSFCTKAKALLQSKGISYTEINVSGNKRLVDEMVARTSGKKTVPQIFIDGVHVGGLFELNALNEAGKLEEEKEGSATPFTLKGTSEATYVSHHDGDTIKFKLGLPEYLTRPFVFTCRLMGVNTPELDTPQGPAVAEYVGSWISEHKDSLWVSCHGFDCFGRLLVYVFPSSDDLKEGPTKSLNTHLVASGMASVYAHKKKVGV
jgi:glutaredoxin 3